MTHKDFMSKIVEYYGDYPAEVVADETYRFLKAKIKEKDLQDLFVLITEAYSTKWKVPPDKATFNDTYSIGRITTKYMFEDCDENK